MHTHQDPYRVIIAEHFEEKVQPRFQRFDWQPICTKCGTFGFDLSWLEAICYVGSSVGARNSHHPGDHALASPEPPQPLDIALEVLAARNNAQKGLEADRVRRHGLCLLGLLQTPDASTPLQTN